MTDRGQRALVVDDEPGIRYFVAASLRRLGFECDEAPSGEAALERTDNEPFDIIFMDVRMPGIGGLEALRRLRERSVPSKIVILSALDDPDMAANAMAEIGADGFLAKPCTITQVQQAAINLGAIAA